MGAAAQAGDVGQDPAQGAGNASHFMRPRIGLTVGDPAGIGPEISEYAAHDPHVTAVCEPVLYGPALAEAEPVFPVGVATAESGRAAYEAVCRATTDALEGRLDAIATAPISKTAWGLAGLPWRGHTDLLAHLTGASDVAMMFHTDRLRVVLATVHVPLADVPALLTQQRVERTVELAHAELPRFGYRHPRVAVAGLNPHAGEQGLMGSEEEQVLRPAIAAARARGIDVDGPFPGDTIFRRALDGEFDVVVACYHDQGLIPVKLLGFGAAVNVTLGLPIVRTSVDHGTAYDIAGRGVANPSSMVEAIRLAAMLATDCAAALP